MIFSVDRFTDKLIAFKASFKLVMKKLQYLKYINNPKFITTEVASQKNRMRCLGALSIKKPNA
jgi:hypothetical protein